MAIKSDLTFGPWLRRCRRALDLTHAELAAAVGCSVSALRKFEAGDLRPSRPLAQALAGALHIASEDRDAFIRFAREMPGNTPARLPETVSQDHPAPSDCVASNLPVPPTALIGREQECAALGQLLCRSDTRLVTLTGPGGIGKTRLAIQVAAELERAYANGVVYVALAPIRAPDLVAPTIAQMLGITELPVQVGPVLPLMERLINYLREKQLLLLLDNFEQVMDAAPLLATLLAASPGLQVLVTSRAPLRLRGEQEFPVPPLALPPRPHTAKYSASGNLDEQRAMLMAPTTARPWEDLTHYAAVRLFVERARNVRPDFQLTEADATAVVAICARLDGLPLAIELAAARCRLFAPEALLALLDRRLALLSDGPRDLPARQQTLRAEIGWSYDLLAPADQQLFRQLSVFAGGWTLTAVEAIATANPQVAGRSNVLDGLASLVEHSLVRRAEGSPGIPRFTMLETIREYALEQLVVSGEADPIQERHADYYVMLAESAEPELRGPQQDVWLERLEAEHDNLRAALDWCLRIRDEPCEPIAAGADSQSAPQSGAMLGLRLAGALWLYWYYRGYIDEGRKWLARTLNAVEAESAVPTDSGEQAGRSRHRYRSWVLYGLAILSVFPDDWVTSRRCLEEIIQTTPRGDRMYVLALALLAYFCYEDGNPRAAYACSEEALRLLRAESTDWDHAWALSWLADGLRLQDSGTGLILLGLTQLHACVPMWLAQSRATASSDRPETAEWPGE